MRHRLEDGDPGSKDNCVNSCDLKSGFMRDLVANNRPALDGFSRWIFQPGMLFHAPDTWWGDKKPRPAPHEGIDLYSFADEHGTIRTVNEHTQIPAAFAGQIIRIFDDFLGKSIFCRHEIFSASGRQLYSAYGHTAPRVRLEIGAAVAAGQIMARLSPGSGKPATVPPHVHLTLAWVPVPVHPGQLSWSNLGRDETITLIDPLPVLLY
jgi:hypothetical protein